MTKEEQQEKALQYALGTLPEPETDEFEAALQDDRELQSQVLEWQRINEIDARECEQVEPPFDTFTRIMARLDGGEGERSAPLLAFPKSQKSEPSSARGGFFRWGGWAAAACLTILLLAGQGGGTLDNVAAAGVSSDIILSEMGKPSSRVAVTANDGTGEETLEDRMVELAGLAETYWYSRDDDADGAGEPVGEKAFSGGFTIFDKRHKIGFIGVENLPEEKVGRIFNVWAKSAGEGKPVWAGMLPSGGDTGLFFFDLSNSGAIAKRSDELSFFVTEDTMKNPGQPEGPVVLAGL